MINFGNFEMGTDVFIAFLSAAVLILQIFLCFKTKNLWIKLIPVILLFAMSAGFALMMAFSDGWDVLGYLLLSMGSAVLLAVSGIGWGIWAAVKKLKKKQ